MSSSTFRVTELNYGNEALTLIVGPDGTVTPDKETVKEILSSHPSMDINLVTMKKVDAGEVNITLDSLTYINRDNMEDPSEMSELDFNLRNIQMDHDYARTNSPETPPLEAVDELAQTLSMLEEGSLDPQLTNEPLTKITKIVKGKKQTIFVNSKEKQRMINAGLLKERPSERVFKKPKPKEAPQVPQPVIATPKKELAEEEVKPEALHDELKKVAVVKVEPLDKSLLLKTTPKKEKKVIKPTPPDDMALFSTPDIIRRVGKDGPTTPTTPTDKSPPKPLKISPEVRSKSASEKGNMESLDKTRRMSLDSRKVEKVASKAFESEGATKPSNSSEQVSVQDFSETMSNSSESAEQQLEPLPSAEDIRAMIHSENTKTFTINSALPEAVLSTEDNNASMNIDTGSLDLDQSILDNINTDMISEDILYQVAQSLVDNNTELQNVIDKSLNDNLELSALGEAPVAVTNNLPQNILPTNVDTQIQTSTSTNAVTSNSLAVTGTTQIVRPDGRVVVIPPIERPTTRSRNKKSVSTAPQQSTKSVTKLPDDHVSGEDQDTSEPEEEEEEESDDDPNKLWCVCNQPHNNRFMICCDTCEEWYHGKCVNVTKAMGQMMEQEGRDWICVFCKDPNLKRPKAALRRMRKASRTSDSSTSTVKSKHSVTSTAITPKEKVRTDKPEKKAPGCVVCGKPSRNSSIYCSDTCILKHAQGVEKVVVFNRKTKQILAGSNAPSAANLDKWLTENPSYEVVRTTKVKPKMTQSQLKLVKNPTTSNVSLAVQKKGVNIGVLQHGTKPASASPVQSPNNNRPIVLNSTLKPKTIIKTISKDAHSSSPTHEIRKLKVVPASSVPKQQQPPPQQQQQQQQQHTPPLVQKIVKPPVSQQTKLQVVKKEAIPMPQKTPKARQAEVSQQPKQENLRETVKKTFFEQLSNRLKNVEDLKLSDDELRQVSNEIESQLYKCFADTGQKYRNKYRSLIFNIKDPKNQTLWRRICEKSINPYQLVRLSHDDLASQELALWRERETKHQLDMIKKSELDLLNCNRQYVFKTHKGETVFEDDSAKDQVTDVIANPVTDGEAPDEDGKESRASSGKHSKRDRERSKDRKSRDKHRSRSKDRKRRSRSRERSSRHDKRRSRSRDRHRDRDRRSSHKSSRHKKDLDDVKKDKTINTDKLDKKSKEILEQLVDKQIVPPLEDRLWKQEEIVQAPPPVPQPQSTECDSDHEPTSTVTIPTPPRVPEVDEVSQSVDKIKSIEKDDDVDIDKNEIVIPETPKNREAMWKGTINMIDVAHIIINAFEVSGDCANLGDELPKSLDIVGRISPSTVWDYIGKMKTSNSKTISVLRLAASTMEERTAYLSLYTYLSSRQRLGVVKCVNKRVKDFYILPLASHSPIPGALLPITGPGFEESRPALLVGIIVRDKRKRSSELASHHSSKRVRVEVKTVKAPATPPSTSRSYTPPPARDPRMKLPVPSIDVAEENEEDMDEPYSPADSDPDTALPEPKSRLNAAELSNLITSAKPASFMDTSISQPTPFEPFSNKFDGIPGLDVAPPALPSNSLEIQQKMAELDQKIAAQKAEIDKVSKDLVSSGSADLERSSLANIALPSNLQQILESIKGIGNKADSTDYQPEPSNNSSDLTIPLMLPKLSSRPIASGSPSSIDSNVSASIPLTLPKQKKTTLVEEKPSGSVLSSLSEEDLIKKAAEMLGETEPPPKKAKSPPLSFLQTSNTNKKDRLELPPIPGLED